MSQGGTMLCMWETLSPILSITWSPSSPLGTALVVLKHSLEAPN